MNLDVLTRPFEPGEIKQRKGPGGKMLSYVDTPLVIARLNEAFAGEWSFRVLSHEITDTEVVVLGEIEAEGIVKQQFGSKAWENNVSLGDTLKAAGSDCVKKAASLLGVALELYTKDAEDTHGSQQPETEGLTEAQRKLRERRRKVA